MVPVNYAKGSFLFDRFIYKNLEKFLLNYSTAKFKNNYLKHNYFIVIIVALQWRL